MKTVSICICTRKRPNGLKRLLESFEKMHTLPTLKIRIIIVENDTENFSESIVNEFYSKTGFKISYFLESRQGLVYARNRSVKEAGECDFCCFTDDDQIVSSDWLIELLRCQNEFNAVGVAGPTYPIFEADVPKYVKQFYQPKTHSYGTMVNSAFTGCLLLKKEYLDFFEGPFEKKLNFSGGEDSYLTKQIIDLGGKIYYNPNAIANEIIPESRTTIKFIIKRTFRIANNELLVESLRNKSFPKLLTMWKLLLRFCYGLITLFPFLIFAKANKIKGLIKIIRAAGGFSFVFGKYNQFYK